MIEMPNDINQEIKATLIELIEIERRSLVYQAKIARFLRTIRNIEVFWLILFFVCFILSFFIP